MIVLGSLFSGIGGLELGLSAALAEAGIPHRVAWQVEIDPFCRAILARHWPDADRSVTDVRAASSLPAVDLCCLGFPCQDVSSAGLGAGLEGGRSGLWFAGRDVLAALQPAVAVVENVASGKRRYLCRVRSDLHALGYRTTAYQLGAHDVGAPHRRERVFVVAHRDGAELREQPRGCSGQDGAGEPHAGRGVGLADAYGDRCEGQRLGGVLDGEWTARGDDADGCGGAVADAERERREWSEEPGAGGGDPGTERSGMLGATGSGPLAHPYACGSEGGNEGGERAGWGAAVAGCEAMGNAGAPRRQGQAECGLGRGPHGLPSRLDLPARWPAGRGVPQEAWEPPRTVTGREPNRRARLRTLGNAVVPAQAREIGRIIVAAGWLA